MCSLFKLLNFTLLRPSQSSANLYLPLISKEDSGMNKIYLNEEEMNVLTGRMDDLASQGVTVSEEHSGEMNFSGCATGHCQAWD